MHCTTEGGQFFCIPVWARTLKKIIQTVWRSHITRINHQDTSSTYQILTSKRPGLSRGLPPGKEDLAWVTNSATLISGQRDAVLVDTFLTSEQAKTLADWVAASGKNL